MAIASTNRRYPRGLMILYASGSLAVALSYQAFATYIQFVYIDVFGLRAHWVGLAWALYGLWNAVNDPLAGHWSDQTRSRWGRRIPWIAAAFLPLSLTFYLLWMPPPAVLAGPDRALLLYFILLVLAFDLLWTVVVVNWTALFPEMIPDEGQRATVSGWRQIFSLAGLLVGVALPPVLAGEGWSNRGQMALPLAAITALFFALSLTGSRERNVSRQQEPLPFRAALRATLRNRDFLVFLAANLAIQFILLMLAATVPFYTKYVLQVQGPLPLPRLGLTLAAGTQTSLLLGLTFILAAPAMPFWTVVAQRRGAWWSLRANCLVAAVSLTLLFLPGRLEEALLLTPLLGFSLAGLLMLPDLLIASLVDIDQARTGVRREGFYFGMNGFVIRLAFTGQGFLIGGILALSGYVAPAPGILYPEQPATALSGIRWLVGGFPALAAVAAFTLLGSYSLRGDRRQRANGERTVRQ